MVCRVLRPFYLNSGAAPSLIRQGKWLFVSLSNFVTFVDQFQNSRDVCLFLTIVTVRDGGCSHLKQNLNPQMPG